MCRGGKITAHGTQSKLAAWRAHHQQQKDTPTPGASLPILHQQQGSAFNYPRNKAEQEAIAAYNSLFQHGANIIPTSGQGLQCAFNAIINSLQSMVDHRIEVPVPTLEQLQEVFDDENF